MIGVEIESSKTDNIGEKVRKAQRKRLEDGATKGFAIASENAPQDRGQLLQSGFQPEWKGNTLQWGFTAPYAWPQEEGTKPYWAPIDPLKEWSERIGKGEGFAYYVQWKIAQEGIEEKRYARDGWEEQKRYYENNTLGDYLDL